MNIKLSKDYKVQKEVEEQIDWLRKDLKNRNELDWDQLDFELSSRIDYLFFPANTIIPELVSSLHVCSTNTRREVISFLRSLGELDSKDSVELLDFDFTNAKSEIHLFDIECTLALGNERGSLDKLDYIFGLIDIMILRTMAKHWNDIIAYCKE